MLLVIRRVLSSVVLFWRSPRCFSRLVLPASLSPSLYSLEFMGSCFCPWPPEFVFITQLTLKSPLGFDVKCERVLSLGVHLV